MKAIVFDTRCGPDGLVTSIEPGKAMPVIERSYRLSETAAAIRNLETGRARGKIVVMI